MGTNKRLREGIELVTLPDSTGLLSDIQSEQCRTLNSSGRLICQCLLEGLENQKIIDLLKSHYADTEEIRNIESDFREFLAELKNIGFLSIEK